MKNVFLVLTLLLYANSALAETSSLGLQLPGLGSSYGSDEIRSGDLECKNSIGGSTNLEFGVTGILDNYQSPFGNSYDSPSKGVGVYARIVIPLDGPKERINCNSLYELELRKKRLEVLKLQEEIEQLRQLNSGFINDFETVTPAPVVPAPVVPAPVVPAPVVPAPVVPQNNLDQESELAPLTSIRPRARPTNLIVN